VRPLHADQIAADDTAARYAGDAHRWDTRALASMRRLGAFSGRGTGLDMWKHQTNEGGYTQQSALVSLTKFPAGADSVRKMKQEMGAPPGFTYHFTGLDPRHTFDLAAFPQRFPQQHEVMSARPVGLSKVRSVTDHARNVRINWPFTPRSDLAVDRFEEPAPPPEPELPSFLDE
jgi:hypothetical protein